MTARIDREEVAVRDGADGVGIGRATGLVVGLVERAALDGSTGLRTEVVMAALRATGVGDPANAVRDAVEAGAAVVSTDGSFLGIASGLGLEVKLAEALLRLLGAADEPGVLVVDAPRGTDPAAVLAQIVASVERGRGRCAHSGADELAARLPELAEADLVVVERADLLGLPTAVRLAESVRTGARLVLVGDPGLPPAPGPGQVLGDVHHCGAVPVVSAPPVDPPDQLGLLVRGLHTSTLPRVDHTSHEVVVTPAADAELAVRRTAQLVTSSLPRTLGVDPAGTLVLTPRAGGRTGADAVRSALAESGVDAVEVRTCADAVGRAAEAIVLVLGAESAGSLTRDLLVGAATEARRHLSVVHQAGPALAAAVATRPHRVRRTRLAELLISGGMADQGYAGAGGRATMYAP